MEASKIFISYSRADYLDVNNNPMEDSVVATFVSALKDNSIDYWIDYTAHYSGQYFAKVLAKKIQWSDKILFLSSHNSNSSEWVSKEIIYAVENQKEIVPVRLDSSNYNDDFALLLTGIDYIEYYKNPNQSLEKTIRLLKDNADNETDIQIIRHRKSNLFYAVSKTITMILLVLLSVFTLFASVGFSVGYFSQKTDVEEMMSNAFREHRITAVNPHVIKYSGETIDFTYDYESKQLKLGREGTDFFDHLSFEKIAMAISIPLAFNNLFKSAKYSGNGKTKVGIIVAGSIGILCGYSIGEPIGENYALWESEKSLEEYFKRETTQKMVKQKLDAIFQ